MRDTLGGVEPVVPTALRSFDECLPPVLKDGAFTFRGRWPLVLRQEKGGDQREP